MRDASKCCPALGAALRPTMVPKDSVQRCVRACARAGLATFAPGVSGFPLQQCCPEAESPHMVDCGVATGDPVPAQCWFNLFKVRCFWFTRGRSTTERE